MEGSANRDRASFLAILGAEFIAITGFASSSPLLPSYIRELGITDDRSLRLWAGMANSLPALMLALASPFWGILADARGRKPMLMRAAWGGAAVMGLMALVRGPWQLLALRTIQGCLTGTVSAATVLVASASPRASLVARLGLLQAVVMAGNSAGPMLGGVLADAFGNRPVFAFTATLLLVAGALVLFLVREDFAARPLALPRLGKVDRRGPGAIGPILAALFPVYAVTFLFQLSLATPAPILPLFVEELIPGGAFHRSVSGLVIGAASVTGALAAVLSGPLAARFGRERVLVAFLSLGALLSLSQALVHGWGTLMWLRAAVGFLLGGTMPSLNAMLADRAPAERQGTAFGVSTSVGQAGAALGPMAGSGLSWAFGLRAAFAATGAMLLLAVAAVVFPFKRRTVPHDQSQV